MASAKVQEFTLRECRVGVLRRLLTCCPLTAQPLPARIGFVKRGGSFLSFSGNYYLLALGQKLP
jgi:hypothetical protein